MKILATVIAFISLSLTAIAQSFTGNGAGLTNLQGQNISTEIPFGVSFASKIVANRSGNFIVNNPSTATSNVTSWQQILFTDNTIQPQVIWWNPTNGNNTLTLNASWSLGTSQALARTPITFNGNTNGTLLPGTQLVSDCINYFFANGQSINIYTYISNVAGGASSYEANGENVSTPFGGVANGANSISSGTVTGAVVFDFVPTAIIGRSGRNSIAVLGDSIAWGQNEVSGCGFIMDAFGDANTVNVGNLQSLYQFSVTGFTTQNFSNAPVGPVMTLPLLYCDSAICEYGVNDIHGNGTNYQLVETNMLRVWTTLKNLGISKIYQTTITPTSTSTDSWATTVNQTPGGYADFPSRTNINNWIRTVPYPLSGYFDAADIAETARNSGIWNAPGWTTDGLHPATAAKYLLLSACIQTNLFR